MLIYFHSTSKCFLNCFLTYTTYHELTFSFPSEIHIIQFVRDIRDMQCVPEYPYYTIQIYIYIYIYIYVFKTRT